MSEQNAAIGGVGGAAIGGYFGGAQGAQAGAGIGSMLGGLFGPDGWSEQEQTQINFALQKEFAQNGIRWKVEDAKRAGVHPLFALGGNTATYSPGAITTHNDDYSAMGQNLGRAFQAQQTPQERVQTAGQLELLAATTRKEDAMAAFYLSEAARNGQTANQAAPNPIQGPPDYSFKPYARSSNTGAPSEMRAISTDAIKMKPDEVISARGNDSATSAGTHSFWQEYIYSDKATGAPMKIMLPRSDEGPGESMENISWYQWPLVLSYNRAHYGKGWGRNFAGSFFGRKPTSPRGATGKW